MTLNDLQKQILELSEELQKIIGINYEDADIFERFDIEDYLKTSFYERYVD